MKKIWLFLLVGLLAVTARAQETSADALSAEEAAAVAAILAKTAAQQADDRIVLPEETKKQAFDEVNPPSENQPLPAEDGQPAAESALPAATADLPASSSQPAADASATFSADAPISAAPEEFFIRRYFFRPSVGLHRSDFVGQYKYDRIVAAHVPHRVVENGAGV